MTNVTTEVETAAMLTLKGVHGTSRSAAQKIVQHQTFQKTDKGRVGTGVYFWRENIYAKELASCWYVEALAGGVEALAGSCSPTFNSVPTG